MQINLSQKSPFFSDSCTSSLLLLYISHYISQVPTDAPSPTLNNLFWWFRDICSNLQLWNLFIGFKSSVTISVSSKMRSQVDRSFILSVLSLFTYLLSTFRLPWLHIYDFIIPVIDSTGTRKEEKKHRWFEISLILQLGSLPTPWEGCTSIYCEGKLHTHFTEK